MTQESFKPKSVSPLKRPSSPSDTPAGANKRGRTLPSRIVGRSLILSEDDKAFLDALDTVADSPHRVLKPVQRLAILSEKSDLETVIAAHGEEKKSMAERHRVELGAALREARTSRETIAKLEKDAAEAKTKIASENKKRLEADRKAASSSSTAAALQRDLGEQKRKYLEAEAALAEKTAIIDTLQVEVKEYNEHRKGCVDSKKMLAGIKSDLAKSIEGVLAKAGNTLHTHTRKPNVTTGHGSTDGDELGRLRARYITDPRCKANDNIELLRDCELINNNPMAFICPRFPIGPEQLDIVPSSRTAGSAEAWTRTDAALQKLWLEDKWLFGPFYSQRLALDGDMDRFNVTGFNSTFAKLAALSIEPIESERKMFVWLSKLYGHYVEMMNVDDDFVKKDRLPTVPVRR